jgi:hypothetical protein
MWRAGLLKLDRCPGESRIGVLSSLATGRLQNAITSAQVMTVCTLLPSNARAGLFGDRPVRDTVEEAA